MLSLAKLLFAENGDVSLALNQQSTTADSADGVDRLKRTLQILRVMLWMDMRLELVVSLATMFEAFSLEQIRYLTGPKVMCAPGYHAPEWMDKAIALDRFDAITAEVLKEFDVEYDPAAAMEKYAHLQLATPSEIALYLTTASVLAPMTSDYVRLHTWATWQSLHKHKPFGEEQLEDLAQDEFLKDGSSPLFQGDRRFMMEENTYIELARKIRASAIRNNQMNWTASDLKKAGQFF